MYAGHCRTGCSGARSGGSPVADQLSIEGHNAAGGSFTLFVWLWGALVVATLTVAAGTLLQRVTCSLSLRTFGKYSFALYLFHGHANRLFAKIGFNPDHGIVIGPTVLPWQMWYILVSTAASLAVAYLSWHLWEKHVLRLKVLFPTRKRRLAAKGQPMEARPTALFTQPA